MENSEALFEAGMYVKVIGLEDVYQVICYRNEVFYFLGGITHEEHSYDLLRVKDGLIVSFPEDNLMRSMSPDDATFNVAEVDVEEYIEKIIGEEYSDFDFDFDDPYAMYGGYGEDDMDYSLPKGANEMGKEERKLTPREESSIEAERRKQERKENEKAIDTLLDKLNDYTALVAEFGDNEHYQSKVASIMAELTELSSK